MTDMGLRTTGLSIFFGATVLVVFGGGIITARLARRWSAPSVGLAGILIAMTGGLWLVLQSGAPTQPQFMAAVTLFLAGMGLINPIGTAIALEPFGDRAGIASALLGFLQMACAAIGTAIVGALSVGPATAFASVVFTFNHDRRAFMAAVDGKGEFAFHTQLRTTRSKARSRGTARSRYFRKLLARLSRPKSCPTAPG